MIVTQRLQRASAVTVLLLLVFLLHAGLVRPYVDNYSELKLRVDELSDRLERYRSIAATKPALEHRLNRLRSEPNWLQYYLTSKTEALASAELQQLIRNSVGGNGGEVLSVQSVGGGQAQPHRSVTLRLRMRGDLELVQGMFYDFHASRPLLFVDNVYLRSLGVAHAHAGGALLDIGFDVTGYIRP